MGRVRRTFILKKMKLATTFFAATAVYAQKPANLKPLPVDENGDSKANVWGDIGAAGTDCSSQGMTVSSSSNGYSGSVTVENTNINQHCYVDIGSGCGAAGVSVEFSHLTIETTWNDGDYYEDCYDSVHFQWNENGSVQQTEPQCGCLDVADQCDNNIYENIIYNLMVTNQPTSYNLNGSDAKLVVYTDITNYGGKVTVDWQCNSPPPSWDICPSNHPLEGGCYTQDKEWAVGEEVSCEMTNDECMSVSCSAGGIKASFRADLFHTNLENGETFMQQLVNGHRSIEYNGAELSQGGQCGYTVDANGVNIDWDYAACGGLTPTMEDGKIVYSVKLSSPGNKPGYADIEFYVDTDVEASCAYNPNVLVNAEGFWVNQEDVEAFGDDSGDFIELFDCKFYADAAYENQILDHNIVNMGETIYGRVESDPELPGLSYELVGVTVFNGNDNSQSFDVISNAMPNSAVSAISAGIAPTGYNLNFSYLSFGFEDTTGTNQNELDIQCAIRVFIN